jgi:hypothetical protein
MPELFHAAIYVNRSSDALAQALKEKKGADVLVERKSWVTGWNLLKTAHATGFDIALIFAHFEDLEYWAIAREITLEPDGGTRCRFSDLKRIPKQPRRQRKDLTVLSTKKPLPNNFIRSYALVETPKFLGTK